MKILPFGITFGITAAFAIVSADSAIAADYLTYSGKELYQRLCAACHGAEARGDGPVAPALKIEVPDLRLLARRHQGKFQAEQVEKIIDGRFLIGTHGTRTMPIWGEDLSRTERGNPDAERATETLIRRLVDYLRTIQLPAREKP